MTLKYSVRHVTEYTYTDPVSLSHHIAHLTPRADAGQTPSARTLRILPGPAFRRERVDAFGNRATYFSIEEPHQHLEIESTFEISVAPERVVPPRSTPWEEVRDRLRREARADTVEAYGFTFSSSHVETGRAVAAYAADSFTPGRPLLEATLDLTRRIQAEFIYDQTATSVSTPVATVLATRRGVCQDFAHLQLAALRSLGLPARYVSGYLRTHPAPGRAHLLGADASHAWVSVYLPDFGWVDFDPTNGLIPSGEHITLACGRDFADVAPVRGVILGGGGSHTLRVAVDVKPVS